MKTLGILTATWLVLGMAAWADQPEDYLKDGQLTQLRVASTKFRERLEALRKQRVELEEAIGDLEKTVVLVDNMLKEREAGNMPKRVANA